MRIGLRTKSSTNASIAQQTTDWNNAVATFGAMTLSRGPFYGSALPSRPEYYAPPEVQLIPSFKSVTSTTAGYVKAMRDPAWLVFHHEPEADYTNSGGGAAFVSQFRSAYDAIKAANPNVQVAMVAGGFQYRDGNHGADGSFIPPADKCDGYFFDSYRTGASASSPLEPIQQMEEFINWYGFVSGLGKPLGITEYGRGWENTDGSVTPAQRANILATRPGLMQTDYAYLKGLGFALWNLWWNSNSPGDDWKFSDQPSIDAWSRIVAAEAV